MQVPTPWLDSALSSFCRKLPDAKAHELVTFLNGVVELSTDASWLSRASTGQRLRSLADYAASKFDICDVGMHAK